MCIRDSFLGQPFLARGRHLATEGRGVGGSWCCVRRPRLYDGRRPGHVCGSMSTNFPNKTGHQRCLRPVVRPRRWCPADALATGPGQDNVSYTGRCRRHGSGMRCRYGQPFQEGEGRVAPTPWCGFRAVACGSECSRMRRSFHSPQSPAIAR